VRTTPRDTWDASELGQPRPPVLINAVAASKMGKGIRPRRRLAPVRFYIHMIYDYLLK
jgi:hypothetical protein